MIIKKRVESILSNYPVTRNSDIELILRVWELEGVQLNPRVRAMIKECTAPETIRRVRQKFQEEGKYLASKKVEEQRSLLEIKHREAHHRNTFPDHLL